MHPQPQLAGEAAVVGVCRRPVRNCQVAGQGLPGFRMATSRRQQQRHLFGLLMNQLRIRTCRLDQALDTRVGSDVIECMAQDRRDELVGCRLCLRRLHIVTVN